MQTPCNFPYVCIICKKSTTNLNDEKSIQRIPIKLSNVSRALVKLFLFTLKLFHFIIHHPSSFFLIEYSQCKPLISPRMCSY